MSINAVTHDPYAYLDRALPNEPTAHYVPKERIDENGNKVADEDGFGEDGFGFDDFLDIINPLQHIPGISSLYREITGDEISPGSRMIGGTIYGGALGMAASFVNSTIEQATGLDIGGNVIAFLGGDETESAPEEMIAATPAPPDDMMAAPPAAAETAAPIPADVMKKSPMAPPPIITAPLDAPAAPSEVDEVPATTPIGLEWKGDKPAILQQIEKSKTQDLTEAQLHAVFRSFQSAPSALALPAAADAKAASIAYQKTAAATARPEPADSGTTDFYERPAP